MDQLMDTGRRAPAVTTSPAVTTPPTVTPPIVTRLRLAISLFFALDGFVFAGWVVRIPAIKEQIHASAGALGLALLGVSVGSVATMLLTGKLCRRYGNHPVTVVTAALLSLSVALPALTHSPCNSASSCCCSEPRTGASTSPSTRPPWTWPRRSGARSCRPSMRRSARADWRARASADSSPHI